MKPTNVIDLQILTYNLIKELISHGIDVGDYIIEIEKLGMSNMRDSLEKFKTNNKRWKLESQQKKDASKMEYIY